MTIRPIRYMFSSSDKDPIHPEPTERRFAVLLNDLQEGDNKMTNKYKRTVKSLTIDIYDVLDSFDVKNPAIQHAVKKLLCAGLRGHKDKLTDIKEAQESLIRALELEQ